MACTFADARYPVRRSSTMEGRVDERVDGGMNT